MEFGSIMIYQEKLDSGGFKLPPANENIHNL
jgi:hypothetical protein